MTDFLDTVRAAIEKYRMIKPGDRVLVGVSGGPDSAALLTALVAIRSEKRILLRAATIDHGTRAAAVRREIALVEKLGRRWQVPVSIVRLVIPKKGGESWEAAARAARYDALSRLARRYRCQVIALGHTQDDQAETVLMWLLRGAGTTGLSGIPPVRLLRTAPRKKNVTIIRPLIHCSRKEVEIYLKDHRIQPLRDRTNNSQRFLRNRIRKKLLPFLERRYSPQLRKHLSELAEILREDLGYLESCIAEEFRKVARLDKGRIRLARDKMRGLSPALRRGILRRSVEILQGSCQGFHKRHWMLMEGLVTDGTLKALDLPHGLRAVVPQEKTLLIFHTGVVKPALHLVHY